MPAHLDHASFAQPPDLSVPLWRYMDLSKFAALLQKRALMFARADMLGDPFEGSAPQPNAQALQYILELRKVAPDKDPYKGMPEAELTSLYRQMSDIRRRAVRSHHISCWHMNEAESAGMWKLYSRSSDAVCVRTDYRALAEVLPDTCYMGIVSYIDFRTTGIAEGNLFNAFLVKRRSFSHEREARAIIADPSFIDGAEAPPIREVPVDLSRLVKGIYVSPDAPDWFRDVVADLTAKYGLSVPVEHSEMNAVPLY
jgi:hypothetical protein